MITDNPAKRLLDILVAGNTEDPNSLCRTVWENILEIPDQDTVLLTSRIAKTMGLSQLIVTELNKLEDINIDADKHWVTQVNRAFLTQNIETNWHSFNLHIDEQTISELELTSVLLKSNLSISELTKDQLGEIKKKVESLMQFIRESNLDIEIQSFLLNSLGQMLTSIIEYKITGNTPIFKEIDSIVGHNFTDEIFREEMKKDDGITLFSKLADISIILSLYTGLPQIAKDGLNLLIGKAS